MHLGTQRGELLVDVAQLGARIRIVLRLHAG
jgi:hypothetical protein